MSRVYRFEMKEPPILEALMAEMRSFLVLFFVLPELCGPLTGFQSFQRPCYLCGYENAIFRPFVLMRRTSLSQDQRHRM